MLEPLSRWQSTLKAIAPTDQITWTSALARWAAERTTGKLTLTGITGTPVQYIFNLATFDGMLKTCAPTDKSIMAANQMANAWQSAALASPLMVLPGASLGAPSPATTWSAVASLVDPVSVIAGRMVLTQGILAAQAVDDAYLSKLAEAFRNAFLTLTATATGINSLPIPAPLISPFTRSQ